MLQIPRFSRPKLLTAALFVSVPLILIYFVCMFVVPPFRTGFDWQKIQNVWDRWQALNVGFLAFASSLIALSISRSLEDERKRRRFVAAKAFLPHALGELQSYFEQCATYLCRAHREFEKPVVAIRIGPRPPHLKPTPPTEYKAVFSNCIEHADAFFGAHLAHIIELQQILEARLSGVETWLSNQERVFYTRGLLNSNLLLVAQLSSLVSRTFPFARNESEDIELGMTIEKYKVALKGLPIRHDLFDILMERAALHIRESKQ